VAPQARRLATPCTPALNKLTSTDRAQSYQPRTRFREEALDELARSIQASGIIQPLVVRPIGSRFQLIAASAGGARRSAPA